jgi:hypothetical protein
LFGGGGGGGTGVTTTSAYVLPSYIRIYDR